MTTMSDDRATPGIMQALNVTPEKQLFYILTKLGEISADARTARESSERTERQLDDVKKQLADGSVNFATNGVEMTQLIARVAALEQAGKDEKAKGPHWLLQSVISTIVGAVGVAVVWFLMQGAIANANGPATRTERTERTETTTTPARVSREGSRGDG